MHYRFFVSTFFFLLSFSFANGQSGGGMTSPAWVNLITRNALKDPAGKGSFAAAPKGPALYFIKAGDIQVPYLVRVPKGYDPSKPTPVIVFLHGAILVKDSFQYKNPAIENEPAFWVADSFNVLVIFPLARTDFKWTDQTPVFENIVSIVNQVEGYYNVDKKKIFIGGISMGGIATFWFINHKPEMFAGFYAFSAIPRTDGDIHYSNITKSKPLYTFNAKDDPVFSYTEMEQAYQKHKNEAPGFHFSTVETGKHRFLYSAQGVRIMYSLVGDLLGYMMGPIQR